MDLLPFPAICRREAEPIAVSAASHKANGGGVVLLYRLLYWGKVMVTLLCRSPRARPSARATSMGMMARGGWPLALARVVTPIRFESSARAWDWGDWFSLGDQIQPAQMQS